MLDLPVGIPDEGDFTFGRMPTSANNSDERITFSEIPKRRWQMRRRWLKAIDYVRHRMAN